MTNGGNAGLCVSWQEAEDALMAAFEYLRSMPDRERGFLSAGSRSGWPEIVRESWEYADAEARPSPRLSRQHAEHVEQFLTGPKPLANVIAEQHRAFVGRVIMMQLWPGPDGFGWDRVFRQQRGVLFNLVRKVELPTTSDGLRKAYERAIGKVAVAMTPGSARVQLSIGQN
ncbi:hypothetical protein [uncultured Novosphingobium sp.]|uniref:hypothetical protein n=1 Tax=uncultured Novosphingobium sp. TaxID=292277 RepID=UPI0037491348